MTSNLFSYFVVTFNSQMPRTHAADLRTQFEKCIREDGTMDAAIYREFFKRNPWMIGPFLPGSLVPNHRKEHYQDCSD